MGGIEHVSEGIIADLVARLPRQRKTQRAKLGLLVATMLEARSANLMDLAAALPRPTERLDMRYQWIERLLANPCLEVDAVMAPYARELLGRAAASGRRRATRCSCSACGSGHGPCRWRGGSRRPAAASASPSRKGW